MYNKQMITREMRTIVKVQLDKGAPAPMFTYVESFIANHPSVTQGDAEDQAIVEVCIREYLKYVAGEALRAFGKRGNQTGLPPGFYDHLQEAYNIERGGIQTSVPLEGLTHEEGRAKADELKLMGMGALRHAAALNRFLDEKFGPRIDDSSELETSET